MNVVWRKSKCSNDLDWLRFFCPLHCKKRLYLSRECRGIHDMSDFTSTVWGLLYKSACCSIKITVAAAAALQVMGFRSTEWVYDYDPPSMVHYAKGGFLQYFVYVCVCVSPSPCCNTCCVPCCCFSYCVVADYSSGDNKLYKTFNNNTALDSRAVSYRWWMPLIQWILPR